MQNVHQQDFSREFLATLDQAALVDLVLQFNCEYKKLDSKFQLLAEHARNALSEKYGQKTERFEHPGQLLLFPSQAESAPTEGSKPTSLKPSSRASRSGHTRNLKPDLPHIPITPPPPDQSQLSCVCCGTERVATRQIFQVSRYQFVPAKFYFEDLYSQVYSCLSCKSAPELVVKPKEVVGNGTAAPGLLAQVVVARDCDHIPFNRQTAIYQRSGVKLSRSTLENYYAQTARLVTPLYNYMQKFLLQSHVISTDDTPVKVLDRLKAKSIKTGRIWVYFGDNAHPVTLFDYTHSRGRDGPMTYLTGFTGRLQGDCFSGKLAICAAIDTILVACNAHARRYFVKSMLNDKDGSSEALLIFQSLYEIERTAKDLGLTPDQTQLIREQEATPILKEFHKWLQEKQVFAQPKSSFGKAIFYCLNNWKALTQYVIDGRLSIDNNHSEREMKYIAMGRKAWLFFGSDKGGKNHAIMLSLIATCRRHGVEPWAYLTDIIQRLSENPEENLEDLLPHKWKPKYPISTPAEIIQFPATPKVA